MKRGLTGSACVSPEFFFDALGFAQKFDMYFRVKINVRKCGKQHIFDEADNTFIHRSAFFDQRSGIAADALDLKIKKILQICDFGSFSASHRAGCSLLG